MEDYKNIITFVKETIKFQKPKDRYNLNHKLKQQDMDDVTTQLCHKLYQMYINNGNVVENSRDDELNKLRREVGRLKQINSKYKMELDNKKKDYNDLKNQYFELLDKRDMINIECKELKHRIENLNRQLTQLRNVETKQDDFDVFNL